jgi:hypothetical protein
MRALAAALALVASAAFAQTQAYPDGYLGPPSASSSLGLNGTPLATTAATTLFVDCTLGNDSNTCTASGASACLTIQGAVNRIPKWVRHPVTVNVAAGTCPAGAYMESFSFQPGVGGNSGGAYIEIAGTRTLSADAVNSGTTTSATQLAGNSFPTLTPVSAGVALNAYRGKLLFINGGTGTGETLAIYGNAAGANGVITLAGKWPITPNATSTWQILDPCNSGTIINGGLTVPVTGAGGSTFTGDGNLTPTANYAAFILSNNQFSTGLPTMSQELLTSTVMGLGGSIYLSNLCVQSFAGTFANIYSSNGVVIRWSKPNALTPQSGCYISSDSNNTDIVANYATGAVQGAGGGTIDFAISCAQSTGGDVTGIGLIGNVGDSMALLQGNGGNGGPFVGEGTMKAVSIANSIKTLHNEPSVAVDACMDCLFASDKVETSTLGSGPSGYCMTIGCGVDAATNCRGGVSYGKIQGGFYNACAAGGILIVGGVWNFRSTAITGTETAGPGVDVRRGAIIDNNAALATITGASGDITVDEGSTFFSWANLATFGRITNMLTGASIQNATPGGAKGKLVCASTDTSGSPGSATANTPCGKSAVASGASSATITNSGVTATSTVTCNLVTTGAGVEGIQCVAGAGSFVATTTAGLGVVTVTTANASFTWNVLN